MRRERKAWFRSPDSDDHVTPRNFRALQIARAVRGGIFRAFDGIAQRLAPPAMMACTMLGGVPKVGGHSAASRTASARWFPRRRKSACRRCEMPSRWHRRRGRFSAVRVARRDATRASSRFRMRRISSVDFWSSPRERGFRCSVFVAFQRSPQHPQSIIAAAKAEQGAPKKRFRARIVPRKLSVPRLADCEAQSSR